MATVRADREIAAAQPRFAPDAALSSAEIGDRNSRTIGKSLILSGRERRREFLADVGISAVLKCW